MQDNASKDTSKAGLSALAAALKTAKEAHLVTPEENEKLIKAAMKDAKKLLSELRGETYEEPNQINILETDKESALVLPQFGMGPRPMAINANITPDEQRQIDLATEQFKQSVQRVDNQMLAKYVQAIQDGDYAAAEAILEQAVESQQTNTLMFALLTIGVILLPLYAKQRLSALFRQFGLNTVFSTTKSGQESLRLQAERGAKSHIRTIAKDIKNALDRAIDSELTNPEVEAAMKDKYEALAPLNETQYLNKVKRNEEMYKYARDLILAGESRQNVIKKMQENFSELGKRRANVIAGNEANRIFTMSQFDADQQFLAQNQLTQKAYKRLVSNTGHPEAICKYIIEKTAIKPIPFTQDFVPFGKTITVTDNGKKHKFTANYEKLQSGHIHVNCHCRYELLIKQDDGSFLNTYDGKVLNQVDFDEKKHKRDKDGKFAKKASSAISIDLSHINTREQFDAMIHDAWEHTSHGKWDKDVTEATRAYQGNMYDAINIHARSLELDDPLVINKRETTYGETIDNINRAATLELASDTILYRGTEIPYHQVNEVGEDLDPRSFISSSVDKKIAKDFQYKGGSMIVITAKKGQKVILPDSVTYEMRGHKTMGEAEVLLPTSTKLHITGIVGDRVYVEAI